MPRTPFWLDDIPKTLRARRFPTLRAAQIAFPYATWAELSAALGARVPPVGLLLFARYEAVESGDVGFYVRDDLARRLNRFLPEGWGAGRHARAGLATARAWWDRDAVPGLRPFCDQAWRLLRRSRPPRYWRPAGSLDPRLTEVWGRATTQPS